jgi:hypothetical protein
MAALPATVGVAMDVPDLEDVPHGSPARAEMRRCPGATTSGLMRPSNVGPREEKTATAVCVGVGGWVYMGVGGWCVDMCGGKGGGA